MNPAISIIQADMREFFRAGFSIKQYSADHVISALHCADFDIASLPNMSMNDLLIAALTDRLNKALKQ